MTTHESIETLDESQLRAELDRSRKQLDQLEAELRAIDGELEESESERQQISLLGDVCGSLDKLAGRDAENLFWDGLADAAAGQAHLDIVRTRIDAFQHRIADVEAARQNVLDRIAREESNSDWAAEDLLELKREEEDRKNEWLLERDEPSGPSRLLRMPWERGGEEDARFRKTLATSFLACLLLGLLLPLIPLPIFDRWEAVEVPERLTKLIEERKITPPPVQELRPEPTEPEELVAEETPLLEEEGTPTATVEEAEPAPAKGILAFREKFSNLADTAPANIGSQARITRAGAEAAGRASRSLVATDGPGSSGGINISSLSRNVGGGGGEGMAGVQVARASSSIGGNGTGSDRPRAGGPGSSRTDEEIQIVFDRHKAGLYRLYNRELRRNPTLQGQIVLRMTIEPDGSVSLCEAQSSEMKSPTLVKQVVERVKTFDFGAKDGIPAISILYPIDFLPAT